MMGHLVNLDSLEFLESLVEKVCLVIPSVHLELLVQKGFPGTPDTLVEKVTLAILEILVFLEPLDSLGRRASLEILAVQD